MHFPIQLMFWSGWITSLGWCLRTEGGPNLRTHAGAGRTCCVIIATSSYRATRNVRTPPGVERWKSSPTQTFSPGNFEGCNLWRSEALWWKEFFAKASWKRGIQERHELADLVRTRCVFWSTCCLLLSFTNMKHLARISWLLLFFFFWQRWDFAGNSVVSVLLLEGVLWIFFFFCARYFVPLCGATFGFLPFFVSLQRCQRVLSACSCWLHRHPAWHRRHPGTNW